MKKFYLTVMAIFKNESHILEEWIEHYIKEGVEHFYLINNGSTDNFMDILNKYTDRITYYDLPERHVQEKHYCSLLPKIKQESEWLLVCDLDEFVFAKDNYKQIADIIKEFEQSGTTQIYLPWKMFSSNKHIEQPKSVIQGFTDRKHYKNWEHRSKKYIVKIDYLQKLTIHHCQISKGISVDPCNQSPKMHGERLYINEDELSKHKLHLNHYPIQSLNWFTKVKMTRGCVKWPQNEVGVRTLKYFKEYDQNSGYKDVMLANKKYN